MQQWLQTLLHTHDTPERTAAAFGLGVWVAFSPFLGLHVVMGVALAFLLRLNRVAVLAGLALNLPWVVVPYYAAATMLGAWIIRAPIAPSLPNKLEQAWDLPEWGLRAKAVAEVLWPLVWPFTLGSLISSLVLAVAAHQICLRFLQARRRHHLHAEARRA